MEIRKRIELRKYAYYGMHLTIINCILPKKMTPMEIKVIACFMALEGDLSSYRFSPSARKVVMQILNLTPAGLSNYIVSLLDKGFLYKVGDQINMLSLLVPDPKEQVYVFRLVNLGNN